MTIMIAVCRKDHEGPKRAMDLIDRLIALNRNGQNFEAQMHPIVDCVSKQHFFFGTVRTYGPRGRRFFASQQFFFFKFVLFHYYRYHTVRTNVHFFSVE